MHGHGGVGIGVVTVLESADNLLDTLPDHLPVGVLGNEVFFTQMILQQPSQSGFQPFKIVCVKKHRVQRMLTNYNLKNLKTIDGIAQSLKYFQIISSL